VKFKNMQIKELLPTVVTFLLTLFSVSLVHAAPFLIYDARSIGMGSIGVAIGPRQGQFNNPALLPFDVAFIAWHVSFGGGRFETDPDDFEKELGEFNSAASLLTSVPSAGNASLAEIALNDLSDLKFDSTEFKTLFLNIPSKVLGGAVFFDKYVVKTVRARLGNVDVSDPTAPVYDSTLEKRGVSIVEQGVSFAQVINEEGRGWNSWAFGFSPKFILAKTSAASESIDNANTGITFSGDSTDSAFNIDVGILKEMGRYTFGAVIKNLIPIEFKFTNGEVYEIKPQVKVGFGYEKRKSSWEIDLDLIPNDGIVFTNETAYLSMGTEFKLSAAFRLRAGYRQNLLEDNDATLSIGIGIGATYRLEIGAFKGDEETGAIAQLGVDF